MKILFFMNVCPQAEKMYGYLFPGPALFHFFTPDVSRED